MGTGVTTVVPAPVPAPAPAPTPTQETWSGSSDVLDPDNWWQRPKEEETFSSGGRVPCYGQYYPMPDGYKGNQWGTRIQAPDGSIQTLNEFCADPPGGDPTVGGNSYDIWNPVPVPYALQCDNNAGETGTVQVPSDHQISFDEQRIKAPNGDVLTKQGFCNMHRVCTYKSNENLLVFGVIDLTAMLVAWGLPPLPSLDQTVCVYQKEEIISGVIAFLNTAAGDDVSLLSGDIASFLDGAEYTAKALGGNFADLAAAAIEFGRGNFDETVINLLEAIPGWGNLLGDAVEKLGLGRLLQRIVDRISEDDKQSIIDFVLNSIAAAASVPNPATPLIVPLCALITSAIMFGRMDWDEAVFNLLSLGLSKMGNALVGKLMKAKPIQGPVTSTGIAPTLAPVAPVTKMEKLIAALKDVVQKFVDAMKEPLIKVAQKLKLLDANGLPTSETQVLIDHYDELVAAAKITGGAAELAGAFMDGE